MFFQAPTRTPPNRLITPHCLRYQPVLTEPFAVPDIEYITCNHASLIRAIIGIININVLVIHQIDSELPEALCFNAMITVANATSPLIKAIAMATRPRLAQPRTVMGNAAFIKNSTTRIAGRITW
jgi:hypothetical protein